MDSTPKACHELEHLLEICFQFIYKSHLELLTIVNIDKLIVKIQGIPYYKRHSRCSDPTKWTDNQLSNESQMKIQLHRYSNLFQTQKINSE